LYDAVPNILQPLPILIPVLAPLFTEARAAAAARLTCDAAHYAEAMPLQQLLQDDVLLGDMMARYGRHWRSDDQRAVASAWSLNYFAALLPPAVAASSVLHRTLPLGIDDTRILLNEQGAVRLLCLPDDGVVVQNADAQERYQQLVWEHLAPIIGRLAQAFRSSPRVLWGNTIRRIRATLVAAEQFPLPKNRLRDIVADRQFLLNQPAWPDGRANPLHHKGDALAAQTPQRKYLHRNCCLYYRLPDEGYCGACPLAPTNRHRS